MNFSHGFHILNKKRYLNDNIYLEKHTLQSAKENMNGKTPKKNR